MPLECHVFFEKPLMLSITFLTDCMINFKLPHKKNETYFNPPLGNSFANLVAVGFFAMSSKKVHKLLKSDLVESDSYLKL